MQCMCFRVVAHTYQCRVRNERHPKIRCLPIDHDPISWAPVLVPTVRSTIHHRRRMYNSTLDWLCASPPTFSALNFDFCPVANSWNVEKRKVSAQVQAPTIPTWWSMLCDTNLLQNASHVPFALTGLKFFASLTSTCNEPFDDELRDPDDDFMLPNFRRPLLIDDREKCEVFASGGTNFSPTIMSPRYVAMSSNGSLYIHKWKDNGEKNWKTGWEWRIKSQTTVDAYSFLKWIPLRLWVVEYFPL